MDYTDQFYKFYKPFYSQITQTIIFGKSIMFVGINTIGKTFLSQQILSNRFRQEYLKNQHVTFSFINLKDRSKPTPEQIYNEWLKITADALLTKLPKEDINEFSFYTHMSKMINSLKKDEKLCFVILDSQNLLGMPESFFQSLVYFSIYSYSKISFIFLSEPQILTTTNVGFHRFAQRSLRYKYLFLKPHDIKTVKADIHLQSDLLKFDFSKYMNLISTYSRGLHGVTRSFCYLIRDNPNVKTIRQLMGIVNSDNLIRYWVYDVLDSLPKESVRILKAVMSNKQEFKKYAKQQYCQWLVHLGFLKPYGAIRYPLILPMLSSYTIGTENSSRTINIKNTAVYIGNEKVKLTRQEHIVFLLLFGAKGETVSQDAIGNAIWHGNPDKFSPWAIAQIIRRIKKHLSYYLISPTCIQSVRNCGYRLCL
jgi:hypothetical protein